MNQRHRGALSYVLILITIFSSHLIADSKAVTPTPVTTYDQLITAIRHARQASRARLEDAARQEKVREAWEIGKLIDEHVLQHKERADYGKYVIKRLAGDLSIDHTELYRMLEFYRTYPIVGALRQLSWKHYQKLLAVNDPEKRKALEKQAEVNHWSSDELAERIKQEKASDFSRQSNFIEKKTVSLTAEPGLVGTYRVIKANYGPYQGQLALDLGFSCYYRPEGEFTFQDHDIVFAKTTSDVVARRAAPL